MSEIGVSEAPAVSHTSTPQTSPIRDRDKKLLALERQTQNLQAPGVFLACATVFGRCFGGAGAFNLTIFGFCFPYKLRSLESSA